MKVSELTALVEAQNMTPGVEEDREISCGYTCDLLSWVMAHGCEGMAWVTVQTHMNVVAVAALSAEGETLLGGMEHVLRGYEDMAGALTALGGEARLLEDGI